MSFLEFAASYGLQIDRLKATARNILARKPRSVRRLPVGFVSRYEWVRKARRDSSHRTGDLGAGGDGGVSRNEKPKPPRPKENGRGGFFVGRVKNLPADPGKGPAGGNW